MSSSGGGRDVVPGARRSGRPERGARRDVSRRKKIWFQDFKWNEEISVDPSEATKSLEEYHLLVFV